MKKPIIALLLLIGATSVASARQPQRGYRGFLDWSNDLRSEKVPGYLLSTNFFTGFSTSHGAQFNPWLYVGGGLCYEYDSRFVSHILSPFVHGRADLQFGKATPFGELRIGYNLTNGGGLYLSPDIGYRFNWGRKMGVNVGVGISIIGYKIDSGNVTVTPDGYTIYEGIKITQYNNYFSFRIGIDF